MTPTSPSELREHANVMQAIGYHRIASALLDAARQIEGLKKRLALALMELGRVPDPRFTGPTISVVDAARKADSMFAAEPMRALTPAEIDAATDAHAASGAPAQPPPPTSR